MIGPVYLVHIEPRDPRDPLFPCGASRSVTTCGSVEIFELERQIAEWSEVTCEACRTAVREGMV